MPSVPLVAAIGVETEVVFAEAATKAVVMQDVAALAVEADLVAALAVEVVDLLVAGLAVDLLAAAEAVDLLVAAEAALTQVLSCPAWTPTATGSLTSANNRDRRSS